MNQSRRRFLQSSLAASAALSLPARLYSAVEGANDDIRIGVVGFNGRGQDHIANYLGCQGARIVALCDVDSAVLEKGVAQLAAKGQTVTPYQDIRKMLERGIVKTVKSAKKIVDRKDPIVWDILENVLKGHPVLLNRAPTLHRLGIQAFQPKLIEGKAIQLHPLVCTAFNADFDGDQMAVHLPLGNAAILEAQLLMLASHNILNPANGAPITVPSQDMVLGLYYMTKGYKSDKDRTVKGEGMTFYSAEEVTIANNEGKADIHAFVKVRAKVKEDGKLVTKLIETTVGRILFNKVVPEAVGYINELLTKKSLRDIIGNIMKETGMDSTARFLDDIKGLGFKMAFKGGLSFSLGDVIVPPEKEILIAAANKQVDEVMENYNMGVITNNERLQPDY